MVDVNQFVPLMSSKVIGDTAADAERFRATNTNFANRQSSNQKEFASGDDDYDCCPNCNRKFFSGRLQLHLKSCKEGKPLKPVKAKPAPQESPINEPSYSPIKSSGNFYDNRENLYSESPQKSSHGNVFQEKSPNLSPVKQVSHKVQEDPTFRADSSYTATPVKTKAPQNDQYRHETFADNHPESPKYQDNYGDAERDTAEGGRVACGSCGRMFHEDRVGKHEKACKKSNKKRPVFDATKQRSIPEQAEVVAPKKESEPKQKKTVQKVEKERNPEESPKAEAKSKKLPKWKAEHENFIKNLRFNKQLKEMEKRGEDTSHLVAPTIVNDSYVSCPHCFRKFAPATADRHIPKCKDTFNRPKPPKHLKLDKIEHPKLDKSKPHLNLKKDGSGLRDILDQEPKSATTPKLQPLSYEKSDQGNYEQQRDQVLMDQVSPKESSRIASFGHTDPKALMKKTNTFGNIGRQTLLPDIRKFEPTEDSPKAHDMQLSDKKTREMRSQSPPGFKKVFTEAIPKKEELLQNYQGLYARSATYATQECPHCCRKFNPHAAERHIPVCRSVQARPAKASFDQELPKDDARRTKMLLTSFAMKVSMRSKQEEKDLKNMQRSIQANGTSYSDNQKDKPLMFKRAALGSAETGEFNVPKPALLKKVPASNSGAPCFCTSCGIKYEKHHKFCGFCGQKKTN